MELALLSHFDKIMGPRIFLHSPDGINIEALKQIPALMDLDEHGFLIHVTEKYRSANRIFTIPNVHARGGMETLQLSVVVDIKTKIDLNVFRKILTYFSKQITDLKAGYKAFYLNDDIMGDKQVYEDLTKIFRKFYKAVTPIIHALKHAEKKLKLSEKRYRELVENVNSIILRWDFSGKILFINSYGEQFFGYKREELIGKNIIGTIVPETGKSSENTRALISAIEANPDIHEKNINENITREGKKVLVSWTNRGLRDNEGNLIGILSVGNDLSDAEEVKD